MHALADISPTKPNRKPLTLGRAVTIVGAIVFIFISILFGFIIVMVGLVIQHGEKESYSGGVRKQTRSICPQCGTAFFFHYSDQDAFGRLLCKSCGHLYKPTEAATNVPSNETV
jgi:ribosomal protein S27AE